MALSNGPNLGVLVDGAQGEAHYTELMLRWRALDALIQPRALSNQLDDPPADPDDGDVYIVAESAVNDWAGEDGHIARWSEKEEAWEFYTPKDGWWVFVIDQGAPYYYLSGSWIRFEGGGGEGGITPLVLSVTATAFAADATDHQVDMPATVNAGDRLLVQFVNDGDATVTTPGGGATWQLIDSTASGTQARSSWYYIDAAGTEGGTTVNFITSAAENAIAHVVRLQAGTFDAATPPEIARATGTSASPTPPSLEPSWGYARNLWIASYGADDDDAASTYGLPAGNTYTPSAATTTSCSGALSYLQFPIAVLKPGAFIIAASEEWIASTLAVRPALDTGTA